MAKKASGSKYTSKGERKSVNPKTLNGMRQDRNPSLKQIDILRAWKQGRDPWITLENPNKEATRERFIKIRLSDMKGNPKDAQKRTFIIK